MTITFDWVNGPGVRTDSLLDGVGNRADDLLSHGVEFVPGHGDDLLQRRDLHFHLGSLCQTAESGHQPATHLTGLATT
jgi:hypothetical protein